MSGPGRLHIDLFTTLDGVAQAPGGPDEDRTGGFPFGGWQAPLIDDVAGAQVGAGIAEMDALLLGRRTYDIFASYWPQHSGPDGETASALNAVPKYVASRGTPELDWAGTSLLGPDLPAEVERLRARHRSIHVIGSVEFARSLIDAQLFDVLNLWVHPIVLGEGKKVFPDGAAPGKLRLLQPPEVSGTGVVLLRYGPDGAPTVGDMTSASRG
jgi:dihydrofolate reductase